MAEDLTTADDDVRAEIVPDADPPAEAPTAEAAEPEPDGPPPYQSRFQLIFGVLLGVGMAAVAATAIFLAVGKNANDNAVTWSAWHPTAGDGLGAVQQIAEHVGQRYTLPSGNQLVAVNGTALELAGLPVTVAVQAQGRVNVLNGKGVLYTFCGLGKACAIKEGKPSVARHLVLRRESLELALYTFRYVSDIDEVVVMLPPRPGQKPTQAMFYRRDDVGASLNRPLAATLPGAPPAVNHLTTTQRSFLDHLTAPNLYSYEPQQGPDARIYLVLQPIGP
ncbi:MAG: hypothetical protein ACJ76Z_08470 [Thermoleophilaceae bacterium]